MTSLQDPAAAVAPPVDRLCFRHLTICITLSRERPNCHAQTGQLTPRVAYSGTSTPEPPTQAVDSAGGHARWRRYLRGSLIYKVQSRASLNS
jgi:hypothetical protein